MPRTRCAILWQANIRELINPEAHNTASFRGHARGSNAVRCVGFWPPDRDWLYDALLRLAICTNLIRSAEIKEQREIQAADDFSKRLGTRSQHARNKPDIASLMLRGAGTHFSVGGNPYASRTSVAPSLESLVHSLCEAFEGFLQLRTLPCPVAGAVHGSLIGGGVAGCLHVDHTVADSASTFEHGNLVRGVCVLGMLSQTFAIALGSQHAKLVYLQNARLDTLAVRSLGLVHQVQTGIEATKARAHEMAKLAVYSSGLMTVLCSHRFAISLAVLAREAAGHAECQLSNAGYTRSSMLHGADPAVSRPDLKSIGPLATGTGPSR